MRERLCGLLRGCCARGWPPSRPHLPVHSSYPTLGWQPRLPASFSGGTRGAAPGPESWGRQPCARSQVPCSPPRPCGTPSCQAVPDPFPPWRSALRAPPRRPDGAAPPRPGRTLAPLSVYLPFLSPLLLCAAGAGERQGAGCPAQRGEGLQIVSLPVPPRGQGTPTCRTERCPAVQTRLTAAGAAAGLGGAPAAEPPGPAPTSPNPRVLGREVAPLLL